MVSEPTDTSLKADMAHSNIPTTQEKYILFLWTTIPKLCLYGLLPPIKA